MRECGLRCGGMRGAIEFVRALDLVRQECRIPTRKRTYDLRKACRGIGMLVKVQSREAESM